MEHDAAAHCAFDTPRLRVGLLRTTAEQAGLDLEDVVTGLLTEATTRALPEPWRGDYSRERARAWIDERENESPTLLVLERPIESGRARPLGLVILFAMPAGVEGFDLRIGYLFAESAWGRGLATELVMGLADWARSQPSIGTLSGGVEDSNPASARVLVKCGFAPLAPGGTDETIYRLRLG